MKNILVVDDSPTMRRMVIASLKDSSSLKFEEAESGLTAIEKLALFRFDLVILDLNMPDMHGMEVLKFISEHETYRSIPVVVLTTRGDDETRSRTLMNGAALFMTKPFMPADLANNIKKLLNL